MRNVVFSIIQLLCPIKRTGQLHLLNYNSNNDEKKFRNESSKQKFNKNIFILQNDIHEV